ncbi:hypothetical protein [Chryseobacterium sp.]|uniref:hypothetical protein n=1 Tax=Chryseobacterium sp. TaxID=1871047 RepID=UPI00388DF7AF
MLNRPDERINLFLFVILIPLLLFGMVYYGFESSYTRLKTSERPPSFLFTSVYSYRVIPNYLSVYMTDLVEMVIQNFNLKIKAFLAKNGTPFYHGLFLMNSFFLVLTSLIVKKIMGLSPSEWMISEKTKRWIHLIIVFFIVITQYAPTNCDTMALCCYLLAIYWSLKYVYTQNSLFFVALLILIVFSTLVRETACLNIAFFAAITINFTELKKGKLGTILKIIPLVIAFLFPYLGLRYFMSSDSTTFVEGFYIAQNFSSPFNLAGLLFASIVFYFIYQQCEEKSSRIVILKYLFFSLPYLLMITLVGLYWEVRLFLPLIITFILVASHQFKTISK